MDKIVRNSILNEMNGGGLKDLYMRSIFQLYNFKRIFKEVKEHGQDFTDFNVNFSLLEDKQIQNEMMNKQKDVSSQVGSAKDGSKQGSRQALYQEGQGVSGVSVKVEEIDQKVEASFQEMCDFYKVTVEQVRKYQAILNKRVQMIEHVVDYHFLDIKVILINEELEMHGADDQEKQLVALEMDRKLSDLTYLEKLNKII